MKEAKERKGKEREGKGSICCCKTHLSFLRLLKKSAAVWHKLCIHQQQVMTTSRMATLCCAPAL
jgi:hypothetical protein